MTSSTTGLILSTTIFSILACNAAAQDLPAGAEPGRISERFEEPTAPTVQARAVRGLESTVPPAEAAATTLKLDAVRISGSSVYAQETLAELYTDLIGETVTLARVFEVAAAITAKYGQDGYVLSRAIVPPQALNPNGATNQIEIIEGYIDEVRWPSDTRERPTFLRRQATWGMSGKIETKHV